MLRVAFLPLLPGLTDDLYRYIWDGWLQTEGINPYHFRPEASELSAYQTSPIYERLNSQSYYTVYPPLSQLLFGFGGLFYSLDWKVSYYVLKTTFVAFELGGIFLLRRLTTARNLLLYAWNPLVLLEIAGQGHTEALLVPCFAGLIWAVRVGRKRWASIAMAGAGLVKLYPFVLWPLLIRRYGVNALWPGALLVIGVSIPYAAPYTLPHLKESVDLFAHLFEFNAGLYYLLKGLLWDFTGMDWSKQIGPGLRYFYLVLLPVLYVCDWQNKWSLQRACLWGIGLFLITSSTVHPWYFLPVLVLAIIDEEPTWPWFWVGGVSIGTYLFYIDGPYWSWVILGWGGALLLSVVLYRSRLVRAGRTLCAWGHRHLLA